MEISLKRTIVGVSSVLILGSALSFGQPAEPTPPPPPPPVENTPVAEVIPALPMTPIPVPPSAGPTVPPPPPPPPIGFPQGRPTPSSRRALKPQDSLPGKNKNAASPKPMEQTADGLVNLDFVNAEISEIARSISELTKRNIILDEKVRGKITIISPKPVSVEEAFQAFISALEVKDFSIVTSGKLIKIIPTRDLKTEAIQTEVERPTGGDDMYVTRLIPVRYIRSSEIVKSLRSLVSKNGDMISYDPTNTLVITDKVGNLRRLLKIINELDQKGHQESLAVIRLKYAPAADTAAKIMQIFDLKGGNRGGAPNPQAPATGDQGSQFISQIIPDERTNSIIVLASQDGIERVRDVVQKIDRELEKEIGSGKIHVLYLQYADATELSGTLASLAGGGGGGGSRPRLSNRSTSGGTGNMFTRTPGAGAPTPPVPSAPTSAAISGGDIFGGDVRITADVQTNSLVITAAPEDYEQLLNVIRKLDVRRPQAFMEAMILEVDIDKALDLGVAGNMATQVGSSANPTSIFGATNFGSNSSIFLPTSSSAIQGLTVGMQSRTIDVPLAGDQKLTIPVYGALFRALQTNGTINVLSTPNILTQDNTEAEIVVGQVVPFITAQGRDINNQPINQIQRENVAITLRVRPQINESDDVTMDIFQEIQDLVPGADINTFGPTTSKRSATTSVVVKNAQTVTIGGLISDRETISISKVPILGDIPLIGWFFKNKSRTKRKTSLVIFMTPYIIRQPEDLMELSIRKNNERLRFLKENNLPENTALQKYDLDKGLQVPPSKIPEKENAPVPADSPTGSFMPPTAGEKK